MAWLRLIRWTNLLIVFATQALVWWCIMRPLPQLYDVQQVLNGSGFLLVALSTVLIAAAGYIINDYFDVKIDAINKPDKVILTTEIKRRQAIIVHSVFNALALLLAALVARKAGNYWLLLLQIGCTLLLWLYSTHFKRMFVSGNMVVSLMTGLTVAILVFYEPGLYPFLKEKAILTTLSGSTRLNPVYTIGVFAVFAFLTTWMREVVKDMEDLKGDLNEGCETMPIRWGLLRSTRFVQGLGAIVCLSLLLAFLRLLLAGYYVTAGVTLAGLLGPFLWWMNWLPKGADTTHYAKGSSHLKGLMLAGLVALVVLWLETGIKAASF